MQWYSIYCILWYYCMCYSTNRCNNSTTVELIYGHSLQALVLYAADWQLKVTIAWHWSFYSAVSCLSNQLTQILIGSSISQIAISETSCKQPPPVSDHLSLTTRVAAYRRFHCIYFMVLYTMWYYTCMCYSTVSTNGNIWRFGETKLIVLSQKQYPIHWICPV